MTATQKLLTGRSSQFADSGGGGVSMADVLLQKPYFSAHGLLPANTIKENVNSLDALDFTNLTGGTLVQSKAQIKYTPSGLHSNFGWDMGALYSKVLLVVSNIRARSYNFGAFVAPTLPAAGHPSDGYMALSEPVTPAMQLYKNIAGPSETVLATEASIGMADSVGAPFTGIAIYCDGTGNVQRAFVRVGFGQWIEYGVAADVSYTSFRYAGFFCGNLGSVAEWITAAIGIYAE